MTTQSMINQKMKSSREMTKRLNEARASVQRVSDHLDKEWDENAKGITAFKPISTWADVGDIERVVELLTDIEHSLEERSGRGKNAIQN